MEQAFTLEDVIRLLYHETTAEEARLISVALEEDPALNRMMATAQEVKTELDQLVLSPSHDTLDSILDYSASAALEASM